MAKATRAVDLPKSVGPVSRILWLGFSRWAASTVVWIGQGFPLNSTRAAVLACTTGSLTRRMALVSSTWRSMAWRSRCICSATWPGLSSLCLASTAWMRSALSL